MCPANQSPQEDTPVKESVNVFLGRLIPNGWWVEVSVGWSSTCGNLLLGGSSYTANGSRNVVQSRQEHSLLVPLRLKSGTCNEVVEGALKSVLSFCRSVCGIIVESGPGQKLCGTILVSRMRLDFLYNKLCRGRHSIKSTTSS